VYNQLNDVYQGYKKVFTDGSKQGAAVAAAAVTDGKVLVKRLPDNASIFSAESQAILLALEIISQSYNKDYLICSDSLSCIKSIENRDLKNPLILKILEHLNQNLSSGYTITFIWVPSHIGIAGNTAADGAAKAALCLTFTYHTQTSKHWYLHTPIVVGNSLGVLKRIINFTKYNLP
jgi:ribonuclease HI